MNIFSIIFQLYPEIGFLSWKLVITFFSTLPTMADPFLAPTV